MMTKTLLAALAILGSTTAAMADHRSGRGGFRADVSVRPAWRTTTPRVAVHHWYRDNDYGRDYDRDDDFRERGHGWVTHRPIVVQPTYVQPIAPPVYQSSWPLPTQYEQPVYEQPVYEQPLYTQPAYEQPAAYDDNCDTNGQYTGPYTQTSDRYASGWMDLTDDTSLTRGREVFNLGGQAGPIDELMLQADGGETQIDTVQAVFTDGSSQQFPLRTTINANNPRVTLNLGHRDIATLAVYGSAGYGAHYRVLGRD